MHRIPRHSTWQTVLLCLAILPTATQALAQGATRPIKFPEKITDPGYVLNAFDVGACRVTGQPSEATLRSLAKDGYTTVICLRTQPEMDDRAQVPFDEPALLKELGIKYVHIPLGAERSYRPEAVKQFAEALDQSNGKALLHCTVAWRATYMWMAYLVAHRGFTVGEAMRHGAAMYITGDRTAAMLGQELLYSPVPRIEGARKPKEGSLCKPGSKLAITSPKVVNPPTNNSRDFVMWDLGAILNTGQPDEKKLRELASQGVKAIVNLRTSSEMASLKANGFDEEALAKELGMTYVQVPIQAWPTFTPANLALIAEAFDKAQGRILFHCSTAARTTQALVPYLVKYHNMDVEEALKVGDSMRSQNTMLQDLLGVDFRVKLKP